MYLDSGHCPQSVIIIEPILNPFSGVIPCLDSQGKKTGGETVIHVLPITFRNYMLIKKKNPMLFPAPDAVVCIGCDSHYGPNKKMLETAFERPYVLYFEYDSEYIHNKQFKNMGTQGKDDGKLVMEH